MDRDERPGASPLPMILLGAVVLVLVLGGGAFAWFASGLQPVPAPAQAEEPKAAEERRARAPSPEDPGFEPPPSVRIEDTSRRTLEKTQSEQAERQK